MRPTRTTLLRASHIRPATPINATRITPLKPAPLALLPPIPLYRRLLRAHRRKLGADERILGDAYIKSEFRAHRAVDNPVQIVGFLTEWQLYAQAVEGESWRGGRIEAGKFEKMSDEQVRQLYELMRAIQGHEDAGGEE